MYIDRRLWLFTEGVRGRIAAATGIGLLAACTGIVRLALLGWLLAQVFQGTPLEDLVLPFALVAMVMCLRGVLEYWREMVAHGTAARVQTKLRLRLFDRVVALGPAHFGQTRTGAVIGAMVDGVEQLETYFGRYLPQLLVSVLTPVLVFVGIAFLDVYVALSLLFFALLALVAPQAFHRWDSRNSFARARAYKNFASEFLDSIQGLATLKAFGQSRARGRALAEKAHELFRSTMWVLATNSASRGISDTAITVGAAVTLGIGAYRVDSGAMSLTVLLVVLMMGVEVFRPLRDLRGVMHQGMLGQAAARAVFEVLDAVPAVPDRAEDGPAPEAPTITFDDVRFRYPTVAQDTHSGLAFHVAAGERVGVVGSSGAGKSSLVRLLQRQYDVTEGAIRVGGVDIRDLSLDQLRRQIAVVNQDTYLFHGTVEENLRFGKPDATQAELEQAARDANAHDFISRLPNGYRTVVGERGIRLSGGQRQRVAIARALLRDAPILVLDEALSSVDAENEAVIQAALDRLMTGRTTLVLAHRLSSVIDCDRILVLGDGRVKETGTHAELLARGGDYYRLMAAQAAEGGADTVIRFDRREAPAEDAAPGAADTAADAADDSILQATGLGWVGAVRTLMAEVRPWRGKLAATFLFGVSRVVAFIGVGAVSALAVRAVKTGEPFQDFLIWLAILAPLAGILHWFESWLAHDMAFRMLAEMRIALFEKLDRLAPAYLLRRRTGDLVAMATQDVETVEYFFAHTIAPAFVAVLIPSVVLAVLVSFGWEMALALLPFLGVVALSPVLFRRRIDRLGSEAREAMGDLNAHAVDTVQGLAEIAAFQAEGSRRAGFADRMARHYRLRLGFFGDLAIQTGVLEAATGLGGLVVIVTGAALAQSGAVESGLLPLFSLLAMAAFLPVSEIANIGRQLADTLGSTRRLDAVHREPVKIADGSGATPPARTGGLPMALEGVDYRYERTVRPALRDLTFDIPAGATVALVGPSGAGKTTLAHLLMRFWDPTGGSVRLAGQDLRDYRLDDLRDCVALVAQDTYLFNDTLEANIRLARPDASDAEVRRAVERAALSGLVDGLPEGLGTKVGERGMRLSGGQRQRVAIARAFLKDAPVLILDEATSHLDAVNEKLVQAALQELAADRTTVVIAHRLSTVRNADWIVVLEDGRVAEQGTHTTLLARGGLYAHLVGRQSGAALAPAAG